VGVSRTLATLGTLSGVDAALFSPAEFKRFMSEACIAAS